MSHESAQAKTTEWLTPPEMISAMGEFDLDPCCPREMPWRTATEMWANSIFSDARKAGLPCRAIYRDGLAAPWHGRIWLNPPYGREVGAWLEKMADHGSGIAIVAARTDTKWFHQHVFRRAAALLFLKGRVNFCYPDGSRSKAGTAPSVLAAYGLANAIALKASGIEGAFVNLDLPF